MCLGVPGEVRSIDGPEATVDFGGAKKTVRIDIVGADVDPGDYVLTHAGFAIRKIPERQVERTIDLYESAIDDPDGANRSQTAAEGRRPASTDGGTGR
ncbi:MAG: HypC/HybG/HupF family hydrogenase formation chaperone [Natronomonas sp.]